MILTIALIALLGLTILNYVITRNLAHPAVVQAGIWSLQLIGLLIFRERFIEPSAVAIFIVMVGATMFTIGSHLSLNAGIGKGNIVSPRIVRPNLRWFWLVSIVIIICSYVQYRIFLGLSDGVDFSRGLILTRTLMSLGDEDIYGVFKYGNSIALGTVALLQISIMKSSNNLYRNILFGVVFVATCFMAILSTGRGSLAQILILIGLIYILGGAKKFINRRISVALLTVSVLTFLIFWIMGNAMGKAGDSAVEAANDVIIYQLSPIPALSVYLDSHHIKFVGGEIGINTFRFPIAILAKLGLVKKPAPLIQEFVNVPTSTNIYTGYLLPIKDFGWISVVFFPFIYGLMHGTLFKWAMKNRRDDYAIFVIGVSYLPLLQYTGGETYFSLLSFWIQLLIVGFILTKTIKSFREKHLNDIKI